MSAPDRTLTSTASGVSAEIAPLAIGVWPFEPLAWAYSYGKARVFQTVLGHAAESIRGAGPALLIRRGCVWDAGRGTLVRALTPPAGRGKPTDYDGVALSLDGALVAAIDGNGAVVDVWNPGSGARVAELPGDGQGFPSIALTGGGRWLVTSSGGDVAVFDTRTWTRVMTVAGPRVRSSR